jgi:hypothetical protein
MPQSLCLSTTSTYYLAAGDSTRTVQNKTDKERGKKTFVTSHGGFGNKTAVLSEKREFLRNECTISEHVACVRAGGS